jgi:hypothetical protein
MQQRLACSLIGISLALICALVALLLSDALAPGRLPPMLAFWVAAAAGGLLILGLVLLERRAALGGVRARHDANGRASLGLPERLAQ